ncbi:hypothetical protein [Nostoc sp. PA-18-2419]|uniref:hypothetical protein n=1 Tax=Nostoc sp. PA-18-2419 TaxID=2575443 RepID=UPI00110980E2|nr:hypothetical protein [Nostoc sp. PA-18-2419]
MDLDRCWFNDWSLVIGHWSFALHKAQSLGAGFRRRRLQGGLPEASVSAALATQRKVGAAAFALSTAVASPRASLNFSRQERHFVREDK